MKCQILFSGKNKKNILKCRLLQILPRVLSVNLYHSLITKTCLYKFDPLKPHFYIVKLGFTGIYIIFLISAQKYRLWILVRTASGSKEYPQPI